jgi:hypothetical protein
MKLYMHPVSMVSRPVRLFITPADRCPRSKMAAFA